MNELVTLYQFAESRSFYVVVPERLVHEQRWQVGQRLGWDGDRLVQVKLVRDFTRKPVSAPDARSTKSVSTLKVPP